MMKTNNRILVSNSSFVRSTYIKKTRETNVHYDFIEIQGGKPENETKLIMELNMGSLLSNKKFIIIRKFKSFSKETISALAKTENSFTIVFDDKLSVKIENDLLKNIKGIKIKKMMFETIQEKRDLLKDFAEKKFKEYDQSLVGTLLSKFKDDDIDKMIQEINALSLYKETLTKKDIDFYYKDKDIEDIYALLLKIINKKTTDVIKSFSALKKEDKHDKLEHLYYALSKVIKDLVKMRKYEGEGFSANAMSTETYHSRKYYSIFSERKNIDEELTRLADILYSIEEDRKYHGIKLTSDYFESKILTFCLLEKDNAH